MKDLFIILLACWFLSAANSVFAEEKPELIMGLEIGKANFSGELTNNKAEIYHGVNIMVGGGMKSGSNVFGFFNLPLKTMSATGVGTDFPFEAGDLDISQNGIIPNICYAFGMEVSACLGFGYTNVRVSDSKGKNIQNYGCPSAELHLGKFTGSGIAGGLNASYTQVEQVVNTKKTKFTIVPYSVFVGYNWMPK